MKSQCQNVLVAAGLVLAHTSLGNAQEIKASERVTSSSRYCFEAEMIRHTTPTRPRNFPALAGGWLVIPALPR